MPLNVGVTAEVGASVEADHEVPAEVVEDLGDEAEAAVVIAPVVVQGVLMMTAITEEAAATPTGDVVEVGVAFVEVARGRQMTRSLENVVVAHVRVLARKTGSVMTIGVMATGVN